MVVETELVNVYLIPYVCTLLCGALAGLGCVFVTVGYLNPFMKNLIAGRGFIALAIVTVGRCNPHKLLAIALLFGFMDSLQLRLQVIGICVPLPLLILLPYLLTILVLVAFRKCLCPQPRVCLARKRENSL